MNKRKSVIASSILMVLLLLPGSNIEAKVISYNFPPEYPTSKFYAATVDGAKQTVLQTAKGSILNFGMDGPVEICVEVQGHPQQVVVRPLSAGIKATIEGQTIKLLLPRPRNLSVELDGDLEDPLFVFANQEFKNAPSRSDPKVRYFEGGKIHKVGEINLQDGETMFLEGGAVVQGVIRARGAKDVTIRGPGILDAGSRERKINHLVLRECNGAVLEDFILLDPHGWSIHVSGSQNILLKNTRVIGWRANSDGLDIEYSRYVLAKGCFWRTNDDCIAVKAIYPPGVEGIEFEEMIDPETLGKHKVPRIVGHEMKTIMISNCVLWNDRGGQVFEIGFELRIDKIRGFKLLDCDIIHVVNGAAFSIHNGDRAEIDDVLLENIRIEEADRIIDLHLGLSIYSDDCPEPFRRSNPQRKAPPKEHRPAVATNPYQWYVPADDELERFESNRGHIRNVVIRNMNVYPEPRRGSILNGYNRKHGVENVTFEELEIAGKSITSKDQFDVHQAFVQGIRFTVSP